MDSKLNFNLDMGFWFKSDRYDIKLLYQYRDVDRGIPIEDIDNQLREEGLGD